MSALALVPVLAATAVPAAPALDAGQAIASQGRGAAVACQSCHGAEGQGNAAGGFPRLAGLPAAYLKRQLAAFAEGQRRNAVMQPIAQALTEGDRAAVADHYAAMRPPAAPPSPAASAAVPTRSAAAASATAAAAPAAASAPGAAASSAAALAATLATKGRWSDHLPACEQCHAPGGRGVGEDFPPLAAQPASYLAAQLRGWKDGARPPGPLGLMKVIAGKLSDADVDALSRHYAALPAAGARR